MRFSFYAVYTCMTVASDLIQEKYIHVPELASAVTEDLCLELHL